LIAPALICRLLTQYGHSSSTGDMNFWYSWSSALNSLDWRRFYADTGANYLPGYLYILWALGKYQLMVAHLPALTHGWLPSGDLLFKLPAITADIGTVVVIYVAGRRWGHPRAAYLAAFSYAVNPGVVFDSSRWGQVDSVPAFFLLVALVLLVESRFALCGVALAMSILCKPTALVLLPLFIVVPAVRRRFGDLLSFSVAAVLTGALLFFPFVPLDRNPIPFIEHCFILTSSESPYLTVNAFNLWMLVQGEPRLYFDSDTIAGITGAAMGWILMGGVLMTACTLVAPRIRRLDPAATRVILPTAALLLGTFFVVLTRIHERHLLPTLPVLALTCVLWPRYWAPYCVLSVTYILNLYYVFFLSPPYHPLDLGRLGIQAISVVNVTMIGVLFVLLLYLVRTPVQRTG
jgi:Gpi18-like mannosyltransferase